MKKTTNYFENLMDLLANFFNSGSNFYAQQKIQRNLFLYIKHCTIPFFQRIRKIERAL